MTPDLRMPEAANPAAFKDQSQGAGEALRPDWWQGFQESELNQLIKHIDGGNLELQMAVARADQAYAALGFVRAERYPSLDGRGSVQRRRRSGDDRGGFSSNPSTDYRGGLAFGWESSWRPAKRKRPQRTRLLKMSDSRFAVCSLATTSLCGRSIRSA
jgi:outer membrane protein, multidrug efflux system